MYIYVYIHICIYISKYIYLSRGHKKYFKERGKRTLPPICVGLPLFLKFKRSPPLAERPEDVPVTFVFYGESGVFG